MRNLKIALTGICISLLMASCSTTKRTEKKSLDVHQVSTLNVDSNRTTETETKTYGDTLSGSAVIGQSQDSTQSDSLEVESAGIKLKIKLTPQKDKGGKIAGNKVDFTAIAKPKTTTNKHEVQAANVRQTVKTDAKLKDASNIETKKGFSVPSWVWWLIVLIALVAISLFVKPLFNSLKTWIKGLTKL